MTIEIGSPGVSGYGYTVAGNAGQTGEPPGAETDQASPAAPAADAHPTNGSTGGANSGAAADVQSDKQVQAAEEVAKHMGYEELPGYEASASRCFHRAGEIARSLNHMSLSADHLMLALTMDSSARRKAIGAGSLCFERDANYSARSTILRLSEAMAAAGLRPLGQALVQLRMVWQR
jgi:hypothetical protein